MISRHFSPLVGKSVHHVVNSKQLAEDLSTLVIEEGDILNSHDVVSLFTCTPINKVLDIVKDRLDKGGLKEYNKTYDFNLQSADVIELLDFILSTTYFTFRDKIYRQLFGAAMGSPVSFLQMLHENVGSEGGDWATHSSTEQLPVDKIYRQLFGAAMGSPVSPLAANIFMEHLQETAIATAPMNIRPNLWKRYVDDILEVVRKEVVNDLTEHLNKIGDTSSTKQDYV